MQNKQKLINELSRTVQHNCHIADANHAGDYTLCIYLLKMREFYRWENQQAFASELANNEVGQWLRKREALWDELEEHEFQQLRIGDTLLSPFEAESANKYLASHNLVYSSGLGINNRPHFFLADLEKHEKHQDVSIYISGREYARDMSAPPAMSLNQSIYIRKESFRRMLWEKLETWRWNRPDNALGRAFACYDCDNNLDHALDEMTEVEVNNVIYHEQGEIAAASLLGKEWEELLLTLPYSKSSIMLRAIRDHLADCLTTLPALLESDYAPSWHFYFGNLNNMRKDLFPSLNKAYEEWYRTGSLSTMSEIIEAGKEHWLSVCHTVLKLNKDNPVNQQEEIANLVERNRL